jgi:hypothetical protein
VANPLARLFVEISAKGQAAVDAALKKVNKRLEDTEQKANKTERGVGRFADKMGKATEPAEKLASRLTAVAGLASAAAAAGLAAGTAIAKLAEQFKSGAKAADEYFDALGGREDPTKVLDETRDRIERISNVLANAKGNQFVALNAEFRSIGQLEDEKARLEQKRAEFSSRLAAKQRAEQRAAAAERRQAIRDELQAQELALLQTEAAEAASSEQRAAKQIELIERVRDAQVKAIEERIAIEDEATGGSKANADLLRDQRENARRLAQIQIDATRARLQQEREEAARQASELAEEEARIAQKAAEDAERERQKQEAAREAEHQRNLQRIKDETRAQLDALAEVRSALMSVTRGGPSSNIDSLTREVSRLVSALRGKGVR